MRKFVKQEIVNILKTLEKASDTITKVMKKGDADALQNLLADCQDAAIQVGNSIEEAEGEGTQAVAILEEYCEKLYQLVVGNITDVRILKDCINRALKEVNQISVRREVVFLPYKASMWDSLESVWMAARDDENCDAYVVPIPYFDKNPDGSLGEMHYEGNEYPDSVDIVDWQQYDIEKRKPDAIYIHNPYDQFNRVTSVHPRFYASELKKHTGMLVYIPYFICMNDVPEHFCQTAGVFYADKVIVQSEKVKQTYERVYKETFGTEAKDKFLALGSPKVDKVRRTTREESEKTMPQEWREKIYYIDELGVERRKKVILYNTSVQALLNNKEQALEKLEYVFQIFKKNEQVVLLWRPHPLNETTMQSMIPMLVQKYLQIIERYKQDNFGIYDDTADMNRAIAISDAYYGDGGSLPALYRETGKPILLQNYEITEEAE